MSAFQEERIAPEPFDVRIVLTDAPHGIDLAAANAHELLVEVENGTVSNLVVGVPFAWHGESFENVPVLQRVLRPHPSEGGYYADNDYPPLAGVRGSTVRSDSVPLPTGEDNMYRQYRVTITPHQKSADFDVKVKIRSFHDNGAVLRKTYLPPAFGDSAFLPNGRDILTVPVKGAARNLAAGYRVILPKDIVIPAGGYLVITQNSDGFRNCSA